MIEVIGFLIAGAILVYVALRVVYWAFGSKAMQRRGRSRL